MRLGRGRVKHSARHAVQPLCCRSRAVWGVDRVAAEGGVGWIGQSADTVECVPFLSVVVEWEGGG